MHRELFRTGLKIFRGPILRSGGRTKLVVVPPGSTVPRQVSRLNTWFYCIYIYTEASQNENSHDGSVTPTPAGKRSLDLSFFSFSSKIGLKDAGAFSRGGGRDRLVVRILLGIHCDPLLSN